MPTVTQDHVEVRELVFPAAGARREPGGRPVRTGSGAPAVDSASLSSELVDEALERAGGRRCVRQALGVPSERISDELIDELLAGASTEEEIAGPGGLLADLTKRLVERAMEVELTDRGCQIFCVCGWDWLVVVSRGFGLRSGSLGLVVLRASASL